MRNESPRRQQSRPERPRGPGESQEVGDTGDSQPEGAGPSYKGGRVHAAGILGFLERSVSRRQRTLPLSGPLTDRDKEGPRMSLKNPCIFRAGRGTSAGRSRKAGGCRGVGLAVAPAAFPTRGAEMRAGPWGVGARVFFLSVNYRVTFLSSPRFDSDVVSSLRLCHPCEHVPGARSVPLPATAMAAFFPREAAALRHGEDSGRGHTVCLKPLEATVSMHGFPDLLGSLL